MKYFISIFMILYFSSCSNISLSNMGKWKEFDEKRGFSKYKKFPIALLLYSSSDNEAQKIINNKKISSILGSFTLLYIDVDHHPYILRRFAENTPSLSFIDKDGNNIYTMYPVDQSKLEILIPQLNETQHNSSINKLTIKDDLSSSNLYPGEEREISEFVLKKLDNGSDIPLDLLSYSYRDTGDEKIRQLILNTIKSKLTSKLVDPINGGVWSNNGYAKLLEDFAGYFVEYNKIVPYCKECLFNVDTSINAGLNFIETELKSDIPLFYAGIKYNEPFNLLINEKDLTNIFGNDGFKRLEKAFSLSYMSHENNSRSIIFSPKIVSSLPIQDINILKKNIKSQSHSTLIKEHRAYGNILLSRLYAKLGNIEKSLAIKNSLDKFLKDQNGLIKIGKNEYPYIRDEIEYLDLLIDIYKSTLDVNYLNEAVLFSQLILKTFCEEWGKVVVCSDLPYDVLKKQSGFLALPDYSMMYNSRFALSLLRLYAMTDKEALFRVAFNVLSTFKIKSKKMMHTKINKSLLIYVQGLVSLHSHPLKLYLINTKPIPKQNLEKDIKQKISSVAYPSVILNVIKNNNELSELYTKEKNIPSDIKGNVLVMCLGDECSTITKLVGDISLEIEKFLLKNKDRVLRVIPFWQ